MENQQKIDVKVQRIHPDAVLPVYQTVGASGMDLCSVETDTIMPKSLEVIATGLKVEIPEGYEMQIRPRSGLAAKHGITVLNTPGTVDSDYRGEIKVILMNHGSLPFEVVPGMRIAQAVLVPVVKAVLSDETSISETARGEGGFGHTGV